MEDCDGDGPARFAGVSADLRRAAEDGVGPHGVSGSPGEFSGAHPDPIAVYLHFGDVGGSEIAEPVGVTCRARPGAPDDRAVGSLQEAHTGGAGVGGGHDAHAGTVTAGGP